MATFPLVYLRGQGSYYFGPPNPPEVRNYSEDDSSIHYSSLDAQASLIIKDHLDPAHPQTSPIGYLGVGFNLWGSTSLFNSNKQDYSFGSFVPRIFGGLGIPLDPQKKWEGFLFGALGTFNEEQEFYDLSDDDNEFISEEMPKKIDADLGLEVISPQGIIFYGGYRFAGESIHVGIGYQRRLGGN